MRSISASRRTIRWRDESAPRDARLADAAAGAR
jgi:hypothetical protein